MAAALTAALDLQHKQMLDSAGLGKHVTQVCCLYVAVAIRLSRCTDCCHAETSMIQPVCSADQIILSLLAAIAYMLTQGAKEQKSCRVLTSMSVRRIGVRLDLSYAQQIKGGSMVVQCSTTMAEGCTICQGAAGPV